MPKKKVIVTGATGFIGRQSLRPLQEAGYETHILTSSDAAPEVFASIEPAVRDGFHLHRCDLMNRETTAEVLQRISADYLLHFAWDTTHGKFWTSARNLDWTAATLHLVRSFAESGGKRVVAAGTCAEYEWSETVLDEQSSRFAPGTLYGTTKHALHQILRRFTADAGLTLGWGRIFFLYGPHEGDKRFVSSAILELMNDREFSMTHGRQLRDFMHVEDVAAAFVRLLESHYDGSVNIASGDTRELRETVLIIADALGKRDLVRLGARQAPPSEPLSIIPATNVLRHELGFTPAYDLESGLQSTVRWWKENVGRANYSVEHLHKDR